MKTVIGVILVAVALAAAAYFALPLLIEKETQGLRSELADFKQRINKTEAFMDQEEKAQKAAKVKSDAGLPQAIKALNALSSKVSSLEDGLKKEAAQKEEMFSKQKALLEESLKKQNDLLDKTNQDNQAKMQKMSIEILIGRIREQILKFKNEVTNKNIGLAKNELETILKTAGQLKDSVGQGKADTMAEVLTLIKKAQAEVDLDLPSAVNRMDLFWQEINKLLKK